MSNIRLVSSAFSGKDSEGKPIERIGELAGLGSIIGLIAAVLGLIMGVPLIPMTSISWEVTSVVPFTWLFGNSVYYNVAIAAFMALLGMGLFLQSYGSRDLRGRVGSMIGLSFLVAFVLSLVVAGYAIVGFGEITYLADIHTYIRLLYFLGMLFVVAWQMTTIYYIDTSVTWIGFFAGMLNGMFIPLLAIGQVFGPILVYLAYMMLALGQFLTLIYWWSPYSTIRAFARSPDKAKFAFGLGGFLTFIIGAIAVFIGPLDSYTDGTLIWQPWSTLIAGAEGGQPTAYLTNPLLVYAFLASILFWILLAPRLGAKELKAAAIGEDIVKGGAKILALFLIFIGLFAASQAGTYIEGVAVWGYLLVIGVAGPLVLVGAMYTAKTDIITGLPLILAGVFTMIHPFSIATLVLVAWIAVIITQFLIMIESYIRGLTGFSQGALAVIVSLLSSAMIVVIMLGGLGSGPLAIWPTNRWFNLSLIPGIPLAVQSSLIIILPFLILMLRNAALTGFSYGRGYTTGGIIMGATVLFSFMIPIVAGNNTIVHEANTGAAILLALYSISMVLLIGLNLNLSNDVIEEGHEFEGTLIKLSTLGQLIFGAVIAIIVLFYFSGLPSPDEIALVISLLVSFIVGSEILSIINWSFAGFRLGMMKKGFKFSRIPKSSESSEII
ncbi:hypothetical protein EU527_04085 [Candidatus Thorarchaeota archaeon]|nr:MAG: hypothetical protein EU527_04085 [Candidatus Thorarchaeota archaeon]